MSNGEYREIAESVFLKASKELGLSQGDMVTEEGIKMVLEYFRKNKRRLVSEAYEDKRNQEERFKDGEK